MPRFQFIDSSVTDDLSAQLHSVMTEVNAVIALMKIMSHTPCCAPSRAVLIHIYHCYCSIRIYILYGLLLFYVVCIYIFPNAQALCAQKLYVAQQVDPKVRIIHPHGIWLDEHKCFLQPKSKSLATTTTITTTTNNNNANNNDNQYYKHHSRRHHHLHVLHVQARSSWVQDNDKYDPEPFTPTPRKRPFRSSVRRDSRMRLESQNISTDVQAIGVRGGRFCVECGGG